MTDRIPQSVTWQRLVQGGRGKGKSFVDWEKFLWGFKSWWLGSGFGLKVPLLLSLYASIWQIRRFFRKVDVIFQRTSKLIIKSLTNNFCFPILPIASMWISIHGKDSPPESFSYFPVISEANGKETSNEDQSRESAMLNLHIYHFRRLHQLFKFIAAVVDDIDNGY